MKIYSNKTTDSKPMPQTPGTPAKPSPPVPSSPETPPRAAGQPRKLPGESIGGAQAKLERVVRLMEREWFLQIKLSGFTPASKLTVWRYCKLFNWEARTMEAHSQRWHCGVVDPDGTWFGDFAVWSYGTVNLEITDEAGRSATVSTTFGENDYPVKL